MSLYDEFHSNSENIPLDIDYEDEIDKLASDVAAVTMLSKFKHAVGCTRSKPQQVNLKGRRSACASPCKGDIHVTSAVHTNKPKGITAEHLAKVFRIDLSTAKNTLRVSSQRLKRDRNVSLSRRFPSNDRMLRYKHLREHFFMDTFFVGKKGGPSLRGNTCMQLFVTDKGYIFLVGMKSKSEVPQAMKLFFKQIGVPDAVICDRSGEQTSQAMLDLARDVGTTIRQLEANTPWANRAELYIGILKNAVRKRLKQTNCPLVLWDYCAEHCAKVNNVTAKNLFQLQSQTPHFSVFHEEPDISNLCQFEFYDWCYFREHTASFPFPSEVLGRVLGPSDNVGNEMAQWILRADGRIVSRHPCRPLTDDE